MIKGLVEDENSIINFVLFKTMINLSLLSTFFLILSALIFIATLIWLIIRLISKIFTEESWKTTDTVLSIIIVVSFFFIIGCIISLYIFRPKEITFGGYGARIRLTDRERDQDPNIALSMMDLYGLFDYFFFRNRQNYDLNPIYHYENIRDGQTQHLLLTHKETGRLVYIFPSHTIQDSDNSRKDVEDITKMFDPIKRNLDMKDNWSICLPLGKRTAGTITDIGRFLTGSSVGGHATTIFIEKNNGRITIYHLDPKRHDGHPAMIERFMTNLNQYFVQGSDDFLILPEIKKLSCGVQALANNTHCVYYVFKMVYYYLEGGADWKMNNLGRNICPGAYIPPNELEAFLKAVLNKFKGLFSRPADTAHLGYVDYKGNAYLDNDDTQIIGSYARHSPLSRRTVPFPDPAVLPSAILTEDEDEWGVIEG